MKSSGGRIACYTCQDLIGTKINTRYRAAWRMAMLLVAMLGLTPDILVGQETTLETIRPNKDVRLTVHMLKSNDTIPHGLFKMYFKSKLLIEGHFDHGKRHGEWIRYYPAGTRWEKGYFFEGKPDGEWQVWDVEGKLSASFYFRNGVRAQHWQGLYNNHEKAVDIIYNPEGQAIQTVNYYPSGRIATNVEVEYQDGDTLTFESLYYSNFNIFKYVEYKNGVKDGQYIMYHQNGSVWEEFSYKMGKLWNVLQLRNEMGQPLNPGTFRHGTGMLNSYYRNGMIYSRESYKNGVHDGPISIFDNGKPAGLGQFKEGKPAGDWTIYDKYHHKDAFLFFDTLSDSVFVKRIMHAAKKETEEGYFVNGKKEGKWIEHNPYGEPLKRAGFSQGFYHGKYERFQNFVTVEEGTYIYGNKTGSWDNYNGAGGAVYHETYRCLTELDSNWDKPPQPGLMTIFNVDYLKRIYADFFAAPGNSQIFMYFVEPFSGLDMLKEEQDFYKNGKKLFNIDRPDFFVYEPSFIPPVFPGGKTAERIYIDKHLDYPEMPKGIRLSGSVLVRFRVDEMGLISDIKVLKTLGYGTEKMTTEFIKGMPAWRPSTFNGIPIPCYIVKQYYFGN